MRLNATRLGSIASSRSFGDQLDDLAGQVPSLDLNFAQNKSLIDDYSGTNLITHTRASSATFVDSNGVLQTAANDIARFDHNPTTGESLGLLVEEARTNSVTNNTMVGAVAGTPGTLPTGLSTYVAPTGLTRTVVGSGTVNGINYIDVRFNGTPSSIGEITLYLSPTSTAATLGQSWTASAWLSLAGGSTSNIATVALRNFELNSGAYVRETSTNLISSISSALVRRQHVTTSFGASANQIQSVLTINAAAGGTPIDITLRIGMPQLEQGAFATSVIPTTSATVTRAADVTSITGSNFSSWYNQTEGTVFAETQLQSIAARTVAGFDINDNSTNNRIIFRALTSSVADQAVIRSASSTAFTAANVSPAPTTASRKSAVGYKVNDFMFTAIGSAGYTGTTGAVPVSVNQMLIGYEQGPIGQLGGTIKRLTYWPVRLGNTVLQQITQ